jgi:alpha-tubulin suppressor-like RCC1 family protein
MPLCSGHSRVILAPVFAATILAGCTKELTGPRIATLVIVSGGDQFGVIGTTLTQPLKVQALDQSGTPAAGVVVHWRVTAGGGTVTPSESTTDQAGEATATLRLGTTPGPNAVEASISDEVFVTFSASALTSPPTRIVAASGNNQTGVVGNPLTQDIVVKVTDDLNNPKAGVTVTFAVTTGGGTLSAGSAQTDASGNASVKWTLGPASGAQTILASVAGLTPLTLSATAQSEPAASIVVVSGDNQTGLPGQTLLSPLVAKVVDRFGNPVAGATVIFTPAAGSGIVTPASVITNAAGTASASWKLGGVPGPASVTAANGTFTVTFNGGVNVTYASISAGGRSTCGTTVDNVLVCWGYNGEGQLGIGQPPAGSGPVFAAPVPTAATGNLTFRQTVLNLYHGCGVTLSSIAYCWGVNHDGRLGTNNLTPSNAPVRVVTPLSFRMMAASRNHTCGLSISDRVYCWGFAGEGQVGLGFVLSDIGVSTVPFVPDSGWVVASDSVQRFQAVAAGGQHSCAISTALLGSKVYCWGFNSLGQLGNGRAGARDSVPILVGPTGDGQWSGRALDVPTPVAGNPVAPTIAAGYEHTCALDPVGLAFCWGSNAKGQLGSVAIAAAPGVHQDTPIAVSGGIPFVSITAGEAHTCGLTFGGQIWCWGSNERGQLGNSNVGPGNPGSSSPSPVQVSAAGLVFMAVSAGDQHTCALTTDNRALCWGDNQYGQLGDNREHETPLTPTFLPRWQPRAVKFQPQ